MSIKIIGSNGKSVNLITDKILENKIDTIILEYDLLKEKYNNQIDNKIINKQKYKHLINQLIKLFQTDDLDLLIFYLNSTNNIKSFEIIMWNFIEKFDLYNKLNDCIFKLIDKLLLLKVINKSELLELNNNYYNTLLFLNDKINKNTNQKNNQFLKIIEIELNKISNELIKINNFTIKKNKQITLIFDDNIYKKDFMKNLILSIDNHISIYKIIKSNILNIDNSINIIIENLYKIYNNL
jgi:hypothetical protein